MASKRARAFADLVKYIDEYNEICGIDHYLELVISRKRVLRLYRIRAGIHALLIETKGMDKKYAQECRDVLDIVNLVKKMGSEL